MNRRSFMSASAGAAAGLGALTQVASAADAGQDRVPNGAFKEVPLRFSMPPGWFEGSLPEKLDRIAALGVPGFEILGPKIPAAELSGLAKERGLQLSCIGGAGAIAPGEMLIEAEHDRIVEQFKDRVEYAKTCGVKVLIGLTGNAVEGMNDDQMMTNSAKCLKRLAPIAEQNNVVIVMEALNVLVNHPGFWLQRTDQTMALLDEVASPNVKMCFDIYHQQITEGNITRNLCENFERVGHIHVGDNPGRKEPGTGEINYRNMFKAIYEEGYQKGKYDGFVTFECGTRDDTETALRRILDCVDWA